MKKRLLPISMAAFVLCLAGVAVTANKSMAAGPFRPCFRNFNCLDVWRPVTCSNGVTYSNDCYAARACATGCVPSGDR